MSIFNKKEVVKKEPREPVFKIKLYNEAKNNKDIDNIIESYKEIGKPAPCFAIGDSNTISFSFFDNLSHEELSKAELYIEKIKTLRDTTQKIEIENLDLFIRVKKISDELEKILMLSKLQGE